ncbi:MAG TPA: GAF domain-containing protein [Candidatus Xenobia bacterium]|jgi:GAF domain-containing protein
MGAENLGETPLDQQISEFLEKAVKLVSGQRGLVVTPIQGSQDMQVRAAHNLDLESVWSSGQISQTILRKVASDQQALLTHNAMQDPRFADTTSVVIQGLRSVICVPLQLNDRFWGVLYVDNPIYAGAFKPANLTQLKEFAGQISAAVQS